MRAGDSGGCIVIPLTGETGFAHVDEMVAKGGYTAIVTGDTAGVLYLEAGYAKASGGGDVINLYGIGQVVGKITTIEVETGAYGIIADRPMTVDVQELYDDGSGTGIYIAAGASADIQVQYMDCATGVESDGGGGIANIIVGNDQSTAQAIDPADTDIKYCNVRLLDQLAYYYHKLNVDGGGSAITTGIKADLQVDYTGVIEEVTMLADQTGSIVLDIWKDSYANFPPDITDTITASAKPTISSAIKSQDSTLTGWTKAVTAGDILRFNVDSCTAITRLQMILKIRRTS